MLDKGNIAIINYSFLIIFQNGFYKPTGNFIFKPGYAII